MLRRAEIGVPGSFIVSHLCNLSLKQMGKNNMFSQASQEERERQWVLSVAKGPRHGVKAFCLQLRYNANQHITSDWRCC